MKTTILNRPIITLPPPHPEILYVQFSQEEQIIYRIVSDLSSPLYSLLSPSCRFAMFAILLFQPTTLNRKG
jgi:hypothetical protein